MDGVACDPRFSEKDGDKNPWLVLLVKMTERKRADVGRWERTMCIFVQTMHNRVGIKMDEGMLALLRKERGDGIVVPKRGRMVCQPLRLYREV